MKIAIASLALALTCVGAAVAQDKHTPDAMMKVDTSTFTKGVASSNEFEIQTSRIALKALPEGALKIFAQQMIDDHTMAAQAFNAALEQAGKPVSSPELSPKHAAMIKLLEEAQGGDVALLYTDMQFGAHKEAVALFMTFEQGGDDAALQDFAAKTLPTLETHLKHVKQMVETPLL